MNESNKEGDRLHFGNHFSTFLHISVALPPTVQALVRKVLLLLRLWLSTLLLLLWRLRQLLLLVTWLLLRHRLLLLSELLLIRLVLLLLLQSHGCTTVHRSLAPGGQQIL
jgi:hypothetical protein